MELKSPNIAQNRHALRRMSVSQVQHLLTNVSLLPTLSDETDQRSSSLPDISNTSLNTDVIDNLMRMTLGTLKAERMSIFTVNLSERLVQSTHFDIRVKKDYRLLDKRYTDPHRYEKMISNTKFSLDSEFGKVIGKDCSMTFTVHETSDILKHDSTATQVLMYPLKDTNKGQLFGVAVLMNKLDHGLFDTDDEILFEEYIKIIEMTFTKSIMYQTMKEKEKEATDLALMASENYKAVAIENRQNQALLDICSSIFVAEEVNALEQQIVAAARELLNADKASIFIVDHDTGMLMSSVFDNGIHTKLSLPLGKGIIGHVASTGETVMLTDVYTDPRFNPTMDKELGYRTQSMLSVPIPGPQNTIIGVASLINKLTLNGQVIAFKEEDKSLFKTFAALCGVALYRTYLLDDIRKKQAQLAINMDLLALHSMVQPDELRIFNAHCPPPQFTIEEIRDFRFDAHQFEIHDDQLCVIFMQMFDDLQFDQKYQIPRDMLTRYTLTVRKNYRKVIYHNFTHATAVVHAFYSTMSNTSLKDLISDDDAFSMFLAAINHDIDHRGTNNQFQKIAQTPLAAFYSTSTMERHHFNHAVTILNSEGHNMFHHLSTERYKKCLKCLEQAILATDIGVYFGARGKLKSLLESKLFSFINPDHASLARGIIMTCCDLFSVAKEWERHRKISNDVYLEFFEQGDAERKLGLPYSANLMDRSNVNQIPKMQDDFFNVIVLPAFELLQKCLPETEVLLKNIRSNHTKWKELLETKTPYQIEAH